MKTIPVSLVLLFWVAALVAALVAAHAAPVDALVKPFREVNVSTAVPGILARTVVREGDVVKQGDVLGELENDAERVEVERLAKVLEKRIFDDAGTAKLFANQVVSEDEAVEKRIEREIAELAHRRALAELARKTLRAPLDGIVVAAHGEAGEWVEPGAVVFEIVDIDRVYAELLVTPEEALGLKKGAELPATFPLLGDAGRRRGTVDFIDPRVDASSGLMRIRVILDNPDHRLRPGYRGAVDLP